MNCPRCGEECWRDEVDIGVGVQYGPWRCCSCPWCEENDVNLANDLSRWRREDDDKESKPKEVVTKEDLPNFGTIYRKYVLVDGSYKQADALLRHRPQAS